MNQLLTFLDGVEDASTGTSYVNGATFLPDKVDPDLYDQAVSSSIYS